MTTDDFDRDVWCLLSITVDAVDMAGALRTVKTAVSEMRPCFLSTSNVNFLTGCQSDGIFRHSVIDSDLSTADGMPLVILEALALGRPVISTFIAGIPELVTPDCGWLVPAGNASALADVMQTVLETSADQLTNMGIAGARRARELHDIRLESAKLLQIFETGLVKNRQA